MIIIIAILKKNEILRVLNFVKSLKIENSGKFYHANITRYSSPTPIFYIGDYNRLTDLTVI